MEYKITEPGVVFETEKLNDPLAVHVSSIFVTLKVKFESCP